MIKHLVFFKFKPEIDQARREAALCELRKLPDRIDFIRSFEVGTDVLRSPRSWDAVLIAEYDDLAALNRYAVHEAHLPVVELMKAICESIGSVDYDI